MNTTKACSLHLTYENCRSQWYRHGKCGKMGYLVGHHLHTKCIPSLCLSMTLSRHIEHVSVELEPPTILQGSFRLCNWLSLRRLVSWINHLPPACWPTFWKSNFKQQLGCRFDIMDNKSYLFVFWHMQLYMSWYIRSFFGFTFLDILYFFKYSCTNIFHRRSLYTFYWRCPSDIASMGLR